MTMERNQNLRHDDGRLCSPQASGALVYARAAAVLLLLSIFAGGFGEVYVPAKLIVTWDAAATAQHVQTHELLFRMSFAAYLIESICDVALSLILYVLLRPVQRNVALLASFFGLVSTSVFAMSEFFYIAPLILLSGTKDLNTFNADQLDTLALLSFKMSTYGGMMFTVFYGLAWVVRGYLIFKSGYLPKLLGVLMTVGGAGFIVRNFLLVLTPSHASGILLMLFVPGGVSLPIWLLLKGVDVAKWVAKDSPDNARVQPTYP